MFNRFIEGKPQMKKWHRIVLCIYLVPVCLLAQNLPTVAIIDFESLGLSVSETRVLVNRLRNEIAGLAVYTVVERQEIERILQEQDLSGSGCTTSECLVETGRILNVKYIIGGSIGRVGRTFSISMRMMDVATSQLFSFADYDYTGEIDNLLKTGMKTAANRLVKSRLSQDTTTPTRSSSTNRTSQNKMNQYNTWISGGQFLTIRLRNGSILKGKIIKASESGNITVQTIQGFRIDLLSQNISSVVPMRIKGRNSIGLGIGMQYGGAGLNVDITVSEPLVLTFGFGTWPIVEESGYAIGLRYYFADKMKNFRPRISYLYGINSYMYTESTYYSSWTGYSETETLSQLLVGSDICIGFELVFGTEKRHAIDFDLAYVVGFMENFDKQIQEWEDQGYEVYDIQEGVPIDISIGYRFRF